MLAYLIRAVDAVEFLDRIFDGARARNNEGLMVKDPESRYTPGRRGLGWLKMKKALATLDVVVTGVEWGHGKRKDVLSDYTFAVYDEGSDRLVNIGKAYSGLTDAEIAQMTDYFKSITVKDYGRFRAVQPEIVLEVRHSTPSTRNPAATIPATRSASRGSRERSAATRRSGTSIRWRTWRRCFGRLRRSGCSLVEPAEA